MHLYIDDALIDARADAESLDRVLALFRHMGHRRLELRDGPSRRLTLSLWEDEVFVETTTPGRADGVLASSWDEAAAAARSYLAGRAPKLRPWSRRLVELVIGAPDPDCPLCRAQRGRA